MALTTAQREQIVAWAARAAAGRDALAQAAADPLRDAAASRLDGSAATLADVLDLFDRPRTASAQYARRLRLIEAVSFHPGEPVSVVEYSRRIERALDTQLTH